MQPCPVVTQPFKNFEQDVFVFALAGASLHAKARQLLDPLVLFAVHGPSDPNMPAQPYFYVYVLQDDKDVTHPFPFVIHPFKKASHAFMV